MTDTAKQLLQSGLYEEEDFDDPIDDEPAIGGHGEYDLGDNYSVDHEQGEARLD